MKAPVKDGTKQSFPAGTGDTSSALLVLALAFFLWIRLRA